MGKFGEFFKSVRARHNSSLREFCLDHGFDPGNISRLERGLLAPPETHEKLASYARALGLKKGSDDWYTLFDLAAAERGKIPEDVLKDEEIVDKLPVLFRTLRGQRVDNDDLDDLVERIRRA
jgi:transcriptional regulator with XRE-family HTH domain